MPGQVKRSSDRTPTDAWRELSASDLDQILSDANLVLSASRKRELRRLINRRVSEVRRLRHFDRENTAGKRKRIFERIDGASARLLQTLTANDEAPTLLAYEWESSVNKLERRGFYKVAKSLDPSLTDADIKFVLHMNGVPPTVEARLAIDAIVTAVSTLRGLATNGMRAELARQLSVGKAIPSRIDGTQYLFISTLASLFSHAFKVRPTTTVGGPWVLFLSGVINCCLDKRLSPESAKEIWMSVQKWRAD